MGGLGRKIPLFAMLLSKKTLSWVMAGNVEIIWLSCSLSYRLNTRMLRNKEDWIGPRAKKSVRQLAPQEPRRAKRFSRGADIARRDQISL